MNYNRHIWEGWTVQDFIEHLNVTFQYQTFDNKNELKKWCKSEQPYYKKHIPEVYNHFLDRAKRENKLKDAKSYKPYFS